MTLDLWLYLSLPAEHPAIAPNHQNYTPTGGGGRLRQRQTETETERDRDRDRDREREREKIISLDRLIIQTI